MKIIKFKLPMAHKPTAGFSMLEVLVALLVLSLGLLGLAALQTTAFKFNHESYQRTQAVIQAYDILDRIRANPIGRNAGLYNTVSPPGYTVPSSQNCISVSCSAAQMVDYDISEWNSANASLLAEGAGAVATDTSTSIRTITIQWRESDLTMTLVVEAQL
jgi:type IV pilus assembly protein PilV